MAINILHSTKKRKQTNPCNPSLGLILWDRRMKDASHTKSNWIWMGSGN